MEEGCVEFGAEEEAARRVPVERRAFVADVGGERLEVPGGIGKFELVELRARIARGRRVRTERRGPRG
jgi:hypothetical protein